MIQALGLGLAIVIGAFVVWRTARSRRHLLAENGRVQAELDATSRAAGRLEAMVEHSGTGLMLLDEHGRIVTVNHRGLELLGVPRADLVGKELWGTPAYQAQETNELIRNGWVQAFAGYPNRLELPPGETAPESVELQLTPLPHEVGSTRRILVECRAMTLPERSSSSEVRVVEVLSTMNHITGRVVHEINNPLAAIRNAFLLVRDGIDPGHPHYSFVAAIDRQINQLAGFSQRVHECFDVQTAVDPRTTVRTAVAEVVHGIRQQTPPIGIEVDLGSAAFGTPAVPGAVVRLAVRNALQDLIDGSPPGGIIHVRAFIDDDRVVLQLTGGATLGPTSGSSRGARPMPGPGLALFARFAEMVGVGVEVRSAGAGGTEIQLFLPLSVGEPADPVLRLETGGRTVAPRRSLSLLQS